MKPDKLEQIRLNHTEREGISLGYNPHWDYQREAVQQYNEIEYLLLLIDAVEELAHVQIRQKNGDHQTKRKAIAQRIPGSRKAKTKKR